MKVRHRYLFWLWFPRSRRLRATFGARARLLREQSAAGFGGKLLRLSHRRPKWAGCASTLASGLLQGGKSGPAVMPGDPDKSLLIQAVRQTGDLKMPKGGKLKPAEVQALTDWVKMGAPWPETKAAAAPSSPGKVITPEQRAFWSFQPLKDPAIPAVKEKSWAKTNIDHFVLAKLEAKGMKPVAPADRRALIRRVTLDLTGLPPTPEEVDAFVADKSPNAYEKVVDRLLASPRYGERWGRHWLDVARYAEDDVRGLDPKDRGYMPFSGAYVYRDWVIQAFNNDMPYGEFLKAQLAGDLMDAKLRDKMIAGTAILGARPVVVGSGGAGARPRRRAQRANRHGDARNAGADRSLRALPRSQVRSDSRKRITTRSRRCS